MEQTGYFLESAAAVGLFCLAMWLVLWQFRLLDSLEFAGGMDGIVRVFLYG